MATLGSSLNAKVRLIVHSKACDHQAEPDVAEQVGRQGERENVRAALGETAAQGTAFKIEFGNAARSRRS